MNETDPQKSRVHSQLRAVHAALMHVLEKTGPSQPADQLLASHLRRHHEYGSRDRRAINGVVYGVFRWWGWLRVLAPPSVTSFFARAGDAASPDAPLDESAEVWGPFILGALALEGSDKGALPGILAGECGIAPEVWETVLAADSEESRFTALLEALPAYDGPTRPAWDALVPAWTADELTCPRPLTDLLNCLQHRPFLWLRTQRGQTQNVMEEIAAARLEATVHPRLEDAIHLHRQRVNLHEILAYRKGRVEVQDVASQAVGIACSPAAGSHWWDVCAGGGGKSLHLARLLKNAGGKGTVLATDVRAARLRELRRRSEHTGAKGITIRKWNGHDCPGESAVFDGVLVDPPCSGSGTWARNPWSRWLLSRESVAAQAARQLEILRTAAPHVAPGGTLVYSTCSFFNRENGGVCQDFLAAHDDFALEPFAHPLTGEGTDGTLQIWPWDADCNSMYMARFKRR